MGWMIKKLFLLFCLILLLPVSVYSSFKGLHPPMEIEPELLAPEGMVFVKGGCYEMGDTFGEGFENERPVHTVCVDDFYMGKYEVTQKEWVALMGSNPSFFKGCDTCPVESVSWDDAQGFISRLNSLTGKSYRLPTEAEWEYAARSGGKKEKFAGTSNEGNLADYAWYAGDNPGAKPHPIGRKKPNGLGLYDMTGNVCEWVSDWYDYEYYGRSPKNNPRGPTSGQDKVFRGGSWNYDPVVVLASYRNWLEPAFRDNYIGFRLAVSAR